MLNRTYNCVQSYAYSHLLSTHVCSPSASVLSFCPAMTHLWGKNHGYSSEIEDMLAESASLKGVHIRGIKELLTEPSVRWQLLTVIITSCTYQLCGINAVRVSSSIL